MTVKKKAKKVKKRSKAYEEFMDALAEDPKTKKQTKITYKRKRWVKEDEPRNVPISFKMRASLLKNLDRYVKRQGSTRTEVLERAAINYLETQST